jgi:hypothetical protein
MLDEQTEASPILEVALKVNWIPWSAPSYDPIHWFLKENLDSRDEIDLPHESRRVRNPTFSFLLWPSFLEQARGEAHIAYVQSIADGLKVLLIGD